MYPAFACHVNSQVSVARLEVLTVLTLSSDVMKVICYGKQFTVGW